jgi:hypothetical protein
LLRHQSNAQLAECWRVENRARYQGLLAELRPGVRQVGQERRAETVAGAFLLGAARLSALKRVAGLGFALGHSDYPQIGKGERRITSILAV